MDEAGVMAATGTWGTVGTLAVMKVVPLSQPASYGTEVTTCVSQRPSGPQSSIERKPVIQSGDGATMWIAESFECAASTATVIVCEGGDAALAEPHEAIGEPVLKASTEPAAIPASISVVMSAGLPVVATVHTPVLATTPVFHRVKSELWLTTTGGEVCAPADGGKAPLMPCSAAKSKGCVDGHQVSVSVTVTVAGSLQSGPLEAGSDRSHWATGAIETP